MPNNMGVESGKAIDTDKEFVRLQYQQAMETYRTQLNLLIQIATVLVVADATVVGYAISTQIAGVLFVGLIFPLALMFINRLIFRFTLPVIYVAISLERKFGSDNIDWLATTFISDVVSPAYAASLRLISSITNPVQRIRELRKMSSPEFRPKIRLIGTSTVIAIAIGHIIAPIVLSQYFGWKLF
jgi:hypothetical protein